jgi:hypothetical protein
VAHSGDLECAASIKQTLVHTVTYVSESEWNLQRKQNRDRLESLVLEYGLAPLPEQRRSFICTKCGSRTCVEGQLNLRYPICIECRCSGFAEDVGYTDDELIAYARACLSLHKNSVETLHDSLKLLGWRFLSHTSEYSKASHIFFFTDPTGQVLRGQGPTEREALTQVLTLAAGKSGFGRDTKPTGPEVETVNTPYSSPYYSTTPEIYHGQNSKNKPTI